MREFIADSKVVIIGGGVVGCAIFRRLAMAGLAPLLVEAAADILDGASKGNSALLHTGFDAPEGSVELSCMQAGYREYLAIKDRLNLPLVESGALVVAWDEEQHAKLPAMVEKAHRNGVRDVAQIGRDELRRREPSLSPRALGALYVPGEHIIDPWSGAPPLVSESASPSAKAVIMTSPSANTTSGAIPALAASMAQRRSAAREMPCIGMSAPTRAK